MPEKVVLPIHFEDRSGTEFERLCFAYLLHTKTWKTLDWYGQVGSDNGRDIWGVIEGKDGQEESYCYQCANYQKLTFKKIQTDIDKLIQKNTIPNHYIVISGGRVSAQMKKRIVDYASEVLIRSSETWSGVEFEEKLRKDALEVLKRFIAGEDSIANSSCNIK